jgi:NAD(P)-dependent dehydrogenase (short-subunit alcohol dehydrogenase family)
MAQFDFSGKNVLVTGGSSGIGLAIARGFAKAGARVTVTGTKADAGEYPDDLGSFAYRQCEMTDMQQVEALAASIDQLDVLVNNAGTNIRGPKALEPETFETLIDLHLNAVFRLTTRLAPKLLANQGSVVNIASMTTYFGSPHAPGYGAAKAAIEQVTKTMAAMWATQGVRVNAIAPGWIATKLTGPVQNNEEFNRHILERTPMDRWGQPEEMVGPVMFLADNQAASFVTGVTMPVDGGYSSAL